MRARLLSLFMLLLAVGCGSAEDKSEIVAGGNLRGSSAGTANKTSQNTSVVTAESIGMKFFTISPGSFNMGCTPELLDCRKGQKPAHTVTLTRGFQIQTTELTQGQYRAVMGENPSLLSSCGSGCPVERVTWYDAIEFANALSRNEGLKPVYSGSGVSIRWDKSANGYRLPTEAEWEYAARGGQATLHSASNEVSGVTLSDSNSGGRTHNSGAKKSNLADLHDMAGGVWEWCWDWYDGSYYSSSPDADPVGPASGVLRASRGGGGQLHGRARVDPTFGYDYIGIRLVRTSL